MKKVIYQNPLKYGYNPDKSGAKYTLDGVHYMNNGEFAEAIAKAHRGLEPKKDACTPFYIDSDISNEKISVKSSRAHLQMIFKADTFEKALNLYFEKTASASVIWVVNIDDMITEYQMNMNEFREFTECWGSLQNTGFIRYKATSGKMIKWLEERV